jgi:hypothetical protein
MCMAVESLPPLAVAPSPRLALPAGRTADIFHVPRTLVS